MEERATYNALLSLKGTRPFILSRASFVGSGSYTAHWTGDNNALWEREQGGIQDSIQAVLSANLFNIPVVGADIGGFGGPGTTEELIVRWYQLGAYYTFMRNHRDLQGPAQEPYLFSAKAQAAMKQAIARRYLLLPYFFTQLLLASAEGGAVLRHMSLEFPNEKMAYAESFQFMVGDAVLVSPVVAEGATGVSTFFPAGGWYDLWEGTYDTSSAGFIQTMSAPLYAPAPVFLRSGKAVPIHGSALMTVKATRATGVGLICGLDDAGNAEGTWWTDDYQDSPIAGTDRRSLSCVTTEFGGLVSSTIANSPAGSPTFPRIPLTTSVYVVVYAQQSFGANVSFQLDNAPVSLLYTVKGNVLNVTLPVGVDVVSTFALEWRASSSGNNSDNTNNSSDDKTLTALLAASCCVLAGAVLGLVYYRLKYQKMSADSQVLLGTEEN
jgi:hypothetical protein